MTTICFIFLTFVSILCTFINISSLADVPDRPHIVFVLADDLGYADVGYRGISGMKTPNIDKLANEGIKLDNYYVQPICSPTRSQLLTGRYQIHTGLQHDLISPCQNNSLPEGLPTLPSTLKLLNYSTHMVGKWHLGFYKKSVWPQSMGFNSFFGFMTGDEDYYTHIDCYNFKDSGKPLKFKNKLEDLKSTQYNTTWDFPAFHFQYQDGNSNQEKESETMCGRDFRDSFKLIADEYDGKYSTHLFTEKALEIISGHANKFGSKSKENPLFLYLPFQAVHSPLQVPEKYLEPFKFIKDDNRRKYAGMLNCLDEAIANVTSTLKHHQMWNDTIFIFSTDNGGQILYGGNNYPLRGWKGSLWEGGIKAAGFVSGPALKGTMPQATTQALLHVSDWFPTFVKWAGGKTPSGLDGFDITGVLFSGKPSPRHEILHNIDPLARPRGQRSNESLTFDTRVLSAIRYKNWKLITGNVGNGSWIAPPEGADNSTLDPDPRNKNLWLFDLDSDPNEKVDQSKSQPGLVRFLLERLTYYNSTSVKPVYPPDDPRCDPKLNGDAWSPWWQ